MKTISTKELENFAEIEQLCEKENGPILITEDGQGCFYYEYRILQRGHGILRGSRSD